MSAGDDSYYKTLGVSEKASKEEIKRAYRALSLKYHPDKNNGNLEAITKFQKLSEAYETLGDEDKRQEYDMMSKNPFMRMGMGMGGNFGGEGSEMEDLLSALFGGGIFGQGLGGQGLGGQGLGSPQGPKIHVFRSNGNVLQKPTPIIKTILINMEQVLNGGSVPIEVERWIMENENKLFENETIYVPIPKGVDDNEIIILRDKGNALNETLKGDIKLFVKIENTTQFERKGLDLIMHKNISLKESLCGFSFELKYVNNKSYTLNNNSGNIIPPEYIKVIPNMGLTRENHTGNLLIHFHVEFPTKLSDDKINAIKEIL